MTTIFISGSREVPFVPDEALARVDRIMGSGFDVVVGDSERGVDAEVLRYLASRAYESVSVYTIHGRPRVKGVLDAWHVCKIGPDAAAKTDASGNVRNRRELETAKDRAMGEVADYGLVVWQSTYANRFGNTSVSRGSLRNMFQLLDDGKPVVLYKATSTDGATSFDCHELRSLDDLRALVASEPPVVARALAEIEKAERKVRKRSPSLFD